MPAKSSTVIDNPEFINLQPTELNPLMSSCEIKVFYLGQNRNNSYITKEVGEQMAKTLRGAPIVGYFKEDKGDFVDHGDQIVIDDNGITINCLTVPYGFVSPDAKVWWQKFNEEDDFGNIIEREYLMTTGYLWNGQFEEANIALEGRPQSMELDENLTEGHWATDIKSNMDFFIIDEATFRKICILGEDVEPCFEGASIKKTEESKGKEVEELHNKTFTKQENQKLQTSLYLMMQDMKFSLLQGGKKMEDKTTEVSQDFVQTTTNSATVDTTTNSFSTATSFSTTIPTPEVKEGEQQAQASSSETDYQMKYSELEKKYSELEGKYTQLQEDYQELVEFKEKIEDEKKDALIDSFYMLSDEDKKEVIENKAKYSLDEIESKLSVICVRKKVNFDKQEKEDKKDPSFTYNLDEQQSSVPAWISAVKNTQKQRENIGG